MSHHSAGERLFKLRQSRNLKFREVQAITRQIAGRHGLADFQVCPSRLKGIEDGEIPSVYKLYSLSVVYNIPIDELLGWYRVPPIAEERDLRLAERVRTKERLNCSDEVYGVVT
jgi:transcriptional regulator with XRE-family HTH domain